jgi:hypothetical protein
MHNYGKIFDRTKFDPNEFIIENNICWVILYNNKCEEIARAKFYTKYYQILKDYKWGLDKDGYVTTLWSDKNKKKHKMTLHGAVIHLSGQIVEKGYEIDHKDSDLLNNLDENLRVCLHAENDKNREKNSNNTSGYKGVVWNKYVNKWMAQIWINGSRKFLGNFTDIKDAAKEYNKAALQYHKEFARLNKIEGD